MKILYVTTVGITMVFFPRLIESLIEAGAEVDIACNETEYPVPARYGELGCKIHHISCSRSPLDGGNLKAVKEIRALVEANQYDIVHCHTAIAAACTRLACRPLRKKGVNVVYTAHGFYFLKGGLRKSWLIYYPVEWLCAHWTDVLITINQEDYALAKRKMKAGRVVYIPGVGVDTAKFRNITVDRSAKRESLGLPEDAVVLLSVGELNGNKNHETVIRAMAGMENVYYIIAGVGPKQAELEALSRSLGLADRVKLLGYRNDVGELCKIADLFVFPSFREGLPVSVMEAMASGLPVACSRIRGNVDLVDERGGALFDPHHVDECRAAIQQCLKQDMHAMGQYNEEKVQKFSAEAVDGQMKALYAEL